MRQQPFVQRSRNFGARFPRIIRIHEKGCADWRAKRPIIPASKRMSSCAAFACEVMYPEFQSSWLETKREQNLGVERRLLTGMATDWFGALQYFWLGTTVDAPEKNPPHQSLWTASRCDSGSPIGFAWRMKPPRRSLNLNKLSEDKDFSTSTYDQSLPHATDSGAIRFGAVSPKHRDFRAGRS